VKVTSDLVAIFHGALYRACRLPALRPSMSDERLWWDFLIEMAPLEEAGGPITMEDISGAVRLMKRQNESGKSNWSLRPSRILNDPAAFRDMVLMHRAERSQQEARKRPAAPPPAPVIPEEPSVSPEEFSQGLSAVRQQLRGGAA